MNLHEQFIKETNQYDKYVSWLESKVDGEKFDLFPEEENDDLIENDSYFLPADRLKYETKIDYDAQDLSYQTEIIFPRLLSLSEKEEVENLVNYWSALPYVSVEGNYGMEWKRMKTNKDNFFINTLIVLIDFTKSASDDYTSRGILEQLAEFIWHGTPVKRNGQRTIEGVIKPLAVRADNV